MKIRLISDLHIEFLPFDLVELPDDKETVLCIAGDLNPSVRSSVNRCGHNSTEFFFDSLKKRFKEVIYTPGNHEYYGGDINIEDSIMEDLCEDFGFHFLQERFIEFKDVTFIGGTLWSDFDKAHPLTMLHAKRMSDYTAIKDSKGDFVTDDTIPMSEKFTPEKSLAIHYRHRKFIFDKISILRTLNPQKKIVVMTHHAPSPKSITPEFRGDSLNGAFVSNLDEEILLTEPDFWFHGHVHSFWDYFIGKTRVLCNPRGYITHGEITGFKEDFLIEV